ncbi:hypothetical protein A3K73_05670 [Candidatus Pacearchaeota archaeon RBG_13_36_9]|nr:MAG: hypothetical protein A3K73_05670 [Candidatus Pacearchaeota archaeon RBG_13_36_9]
MKTVEGLSLFILIIAVIALFSAGLVLAVVPFGADITENVTTRAAPDDPELHNANAGNVTYMTIFGYSVTQAWQGYYGNVSGTIMLADNNDKVLYNWSLANPEGEVYATENGTGQVDWGNVECFNISENGNLTALETWFNISSADPDGVNETFSYSNDHDVFYTADETFSYGECAAAFMFNSSGASDPTQFQEVLLTDQSDDVQIIFVALIEEFGRAGFDGNNYDFEMVVLENGHGTDTAYRNYYFYVELQ